MRCLIRTYPRKRKKINLQRKKIKSRTSGSARKTKDKGKKEPDRALFFASVDVSVEEDFCWHYNYPHLYVRPLLFPV